MNIWKILGIAETRDKKEIKKAYRTRLPHVNPEDNAEGFMELREAYEAALRYAEDAAGSGVGTGIGRPDEQGGGVSGIGRPDEQGSGVSGIGSEDAAGNGDGPDEENGDAAGSEVVLYLKEMYSENPEMLDFIDRFTALYNDFYRRIDIKEWEKLLSAPVCEALDTKEDAKNALLTFMMENYLLPCDVIRLMDRHFSFAENKEELLEIYPTAFIEQAIIGAIDGIDVLPYNLFKLRDLKNAVKNIEKVFGIYREIREALYDNDVNTAEKKLKEIDDLGIYHPYFELRKADVLFAKGEIGKAAALSDKIMAENEDDVEVMLTNGVFQGRKGNIEKAKKILEHIIEIEPEHFGAKFELANCLIIEKEYFAAKELLMALYKTNPYNDLLMDKLKEVGGHIAEIIEAKAASGEADDRELFELADCYQDMDRNEDTLTLLDRIEVPFDCRIKASKMRTLSLLKLNRYKEAAESTMDCEELIDAHPEEDRKDYLSKMLYMRAGAYSCMDCDHEEYDTLRTLLTKVNPDFAIGLACLARYYYDNGFFEKALKHAEKAIESDENVFEGFFEAGRACYELGDADSALEYLERARDMEPYHLSTHVYIIKTLLDIGKDEDAEEYIDYLETNGAESLDLEFLKGRLAVCRDDIDEGVGIFESVIEKGKKLSKAERMGEISNFGEIYNLYARLIIDPDSYVNKYLNLIEEGLKYQPGFGWLLQLKGDLLYDLGHFNRALACYKGVAERHTEHPEIYNDIAQCYEQMGMLEDALKAYEIQTKRRPHGGSFGSCMRVAMKMGDYDRAEKIYGEALKIDEENPATYSSYGRLLRAKGMNDEALEIYNKAMEIGKTYDIMCREAYREAAKLHTVLQHGDEAIALLEESYDLYGEIDDLYEVHNLCQIFGKGELAMDNLERIVEEWEISKDDYEYEFRYAENLRLMGEPEKAAEIFENCWDEDLPSFFYSGNIYYNLGQYEKALLSFIDGIEFFPEDRRNYLWAAKSCYRMGRFEECKKYADSGLASYPNSRKERKNEFGDRFLMEEVVYQALYALSKNIEAGIENLKKEMGGELCSGCNFCRCIDGYIELVELYDMIGEKEKALEMAEKGFEVSPYDFDIISAMKRLKRK